MVFLLMLVITPLAIFFSPPVTNFSLTPSWRKIDLSWIPPISASKIHYQIRISTYRILKDEIDWEQNSSDISYPYRIYITTSSTVGKPHSITITGLVNGQVYFFAIKSSLQDKIYSSIDATFPRPFVLLKNTPPYNPILISPLNGIAVTTENINFDWSDAYDPDLPLGDSIKYELFISSKSDFSHSILIKNITTSYYLLSAAQVLKSGVTYYWKVKTEDSENATNEITSENAYFRYFPVSEVKKVKYEPISISVISSDLELSTFPVKVEVKEKTETEKIKEMVREIVKEMVKDMTKVVYIEKKEKEFPKVHIVSAGETLKDIAQQYYKDPKKWRKIYEANIEKIEKGTLTPGQMLIIP